MTNCHIDRVNAGLCETIVELGKRFGLKTVAEGIETTHESHKLQALGCHIGQGYLFAKPMPKAQLIGHHAPVNCAGGRADIPSFGCTTQAPLAVNRRRRASFAPAPARTGFARSRARDWSQL